VARAKGLRVETLRGPNPTPKGRGAPPPVEDGRKQCLTTQTRATYAPMSEDVRMSGAEVSGSSRQAGRTELVVIGLSVGTWVPATALHSHHSQAVAGRTTSAVKAGPLLAHGECDRSSETFPRKEPVPCRNALDTGSWKLISRRMRLAPILCMKQQSQSEPVAMRTGSLRLCSVTVNLIRSG
jgi:hypothetical protein